MGISSIMPPTTLDSNPASNAVCRGGGELIRDYSGALSTSATTPAPGSKSYPAGSWTTPGLINIIDSNVKRDRKSKAPWSPSSPSLERGATSSEDEHKERENHKQEAVLAKRNEDSDKLSNFVRRGPVSVNNIHRVPRLHYLPEKAWQNTPGMLLGYDESQKLEVCKNGSQLYVSIKWYVIDGFFLLNLY